MENSMLTKRAPQVDGKLDNEVSPPVKVAKFRIDTKRQSRNESIKQQRAFSRTKEIVQLS